MTRHITVDITDALGRKLQTVHESLPVVSRHAVAQAAVEAGLDLFAAEPGALARLIAARRERRTSNHEASR